MNTVTFDTLTAARALEAAGFETKQAEALVQTIRTSRESSVTKAELDGAVAVLRSDLDGAVAILRSELGGAVAGLRSEIAAAVNKMLLSQLAVAALLFAALKTFG